MDLMDSTNDQETTLRRKKLRDDFTIRNCNKIDLFLKMFYFLKKA